MNSQTAEQNLAFAELVEAFEELSLDAIFELPHTVFWFDEPEDAYPKFRQFTKRQGEC